MALTSLLCQRVMSSLAPDLRWKPHGNWFKYFLRLPFDIVTSGTAGDVTTTPGPERNCSSNLFKQILYNMMIILHPTYLGRAS